MARQVHSNHNFNILQPFKRGVSENGFFPCPPESQRMIIIFYLLNWLFVQTNHPVKKDSYGIPLVSLGNNLNMVDFPSKYVYRYIHLQRSRWGTILRFHIFIRSPLYI